MKLRSVRHFRILNINTYNHASTLQTLKADKAGKVMILRLKIEISTLKSLNELVVIKLLFIRKITLKS